MAAALTFLGGHHTVGGVHIVAHTSRAALVFDLGVVGNPTVVREAALFHELLRPRRDSPLQDYLRAGMAPLIRGLYDRRRLTTDFDGTIAPLRRPGHSLAERHVVDVTDRETAVVISHLHDDHAGLTPFVDSGVPVLVSEDSARWQPGLVAAGVLAPGGPAMRPVRFGHVVVVGDMEVRLLSVDHDLPGACGMRVSTPDGTFAYTGDWRGHGAHPELMEEFADECRGVDVLVTDASTTGHSPGWIAAQLAENDIAPWVDDVLRRTDGTLYLTLHNQNLARHEAVRSVALAHGRRVVVDPLLATIWLSASRTGLVDGPLDGVVVWDTGESAEATTLPRVTAHDVAADRSGFVAHLPTALFPLLLDAGAGHGDAFAHVNGHPYGTHDPSWPVMLTWMRTLGIRFEAASSHGHALPPDLARLVEEIRPGVVVPVHTVAPQRFPPVPVPVRAVDHGESVALDQPLRVGVTR